MDQYINEGDDPFKKHLFPFYQYNKQTIYLQHGDDIFSS